MQTCPNPNHNGRKIISICMKQECIENKTYFLCILCQNEGHRGHKIMALKDAMNKAMKLNSQIKSDPNKTSL